MDATWASPAGSGRIPVGVGRREQQQRQLRERQVLAGRDRDRHAELTGSSREEGAGRCAGWRQRPPQRRRRRVRTMVAGVASGAWGCASLPPQPGVNAATNRRPAADAMKSRHRVAEPTHSVKAFKLERRPGAYRVRVWKSTTISPSASMVFSVDHLRSRPCSREALSYLKGRIRARNRPVRPGDRQSCPIGQRQDRRPPPRMPFPIGGHQCQ